MSVFASRPALRWAIPAAALVVVIGAGGAGRALVDNTSDALPERSPQQLLMDVAQSHVTSLSGTIEQKSDLGLPKLPQLDGTNLNTMINGNHTVKLWYNGMQHARVSVQNPDSSEHDLIRNGKNVWAYSSADKSATHFTLNSDQRKHSSANPSVMPSGAPSGLSGGISKALGSLAGTTKISTDGTAKVAGRQAYELVVAPKGDASRVQQIRIAIDGSKHIPLRFQVYARGSNAPVFQAGFTHVSFAKPDASEFTFNPPSGTKVTQGKAGDYAKGKDHQPQGKATDGAKPKVVGDGWTSVVVASGVDTKVPAGKTAEQKKASAAATKFLNSLPKVHGDWGSGKLIKTKLFSVLLTDDGRLIAGAVDPAKLYHAAAQSK